MILGVGENETHKKCTGQERNCLIIFDDFGKIVIFPQI